MTQALEALLHEYQDKHGEGWHLKAVSDLLALHIAGAGHEGHKPTYEAVKYKMLWQWLGPIVAAGVAATEQQAAGDVWEPAPDGPIFDIVIKDGGRLIVWGRNPQDFSMLPTEYRLCHLVQRPASGEGEP